MLTRRKNMHTVVKDVYAWGAETEIKDLAQLVAVTAGCECTNIKPKTGKRKTRKLVIKKPGTEGVHIFQWLGSDFFGNKDLGTAAVKTVIIPKIEKAKGPIYKTKKVNREIVNDRLSDLCRKTIAYNAVVAIEVGTAWPKTCDCTKGTIFARIFYNSKVKRFYWECPACYKTTLPSTDLQKKMKDRTSSTFQREITVG
jgi:Zn finger protein HypA/HybF involved in hydrogenase expression